MMETTVVFVADPALLELYAHARGCEPPDVVQEDEVQWALMGISDEHVRPVNRLCHNGLTYTQAVELVKQRWVCDIETEQDALEAFADHLVGEHAISVESYTDEAGQQCFGLWKMRGNDDARLPHESVRMTNLKPAFSHRNQ